MASFGNLNVDGVVRLTQQSSTLSNNSGETNIYAKDDGQLYYNSGTETKLAPERDSGSTTYIQNTYMTQTISFNKTFTSPPKVTAKNMKRSFHATNVTTTDFEVQARNGGFLSQLDVAAADTGQYPALVILDNGNPAAVYHEPTTNDGKLRYAYSTEHTGAGGWTTQTLDSDATNTGIGIHPSIKILSGGTPGVAYINTSTTRLRFIYSTDLDGASNWQTPVDVATGKSFTDATLVIRNDGTPGICVYNNTDSRLQFYYSSSAVGASGTWSSVNIHSSATGTSSDMILLSDNTPVVFVSDSSGNLAYKKASNTAGTTWPASLQTLDNPTGTGITHPAAILLSSNNIACAYRDGDAGALDLKYIVSTVNSPADSSDFITPYTLESGGNTGFFPSMYVTGNGFPGIIYNNDTTLIIYYSSTTDGAVVGDWLGSGIVADVTATDANRRIVATLSNGDPLIIYYDVTNTELRLVHDMLRMIDWVAVEYSD